MDESTHENACIALCRTAKGKLYEETQAMNRTQENESSFERSRPLVPEAPDWFNRARDIANRRPVFRSLPTPPPPPPPRTLAESRNRFGRQLLVVVPSLVALPLIIVIGYWSRSLPGAGNRAAAQSGRATARENLVDHPSGQAIVAEWEEVALASAETTAIPDEDTTVDHDQIPTESKTQDWRLGPQKSLAPDTAAVASPERGSPVVQETFGRVVWLGQETGHNAEAGFSLRRPGAIRQISAEVVQPASTWFDVAASNAACDTGTCPAPVRHLDRKLNTALIWSSTPEEAAARAEQEGKLVFLIHVSGNFAQPGFT
jgi:hypothetical protein